MTLAHELLDVMAARADGDPAAALVARAEPDRPHEELACDVLVVGGGTGGVAAALAAARAALPAAVRGRVGL